MKNGIKQEDRPIPCDYYMTFSTSAFFYADPARFYEKNKVDQMGKQTQTNKEKQKDLSSKIPWK